MTPEQLLELADHHDREADRNRDLAPRINLPAMREHIKHLSDWHAKQAEGLRALAAKTTP
jgi:hypothetical protein